jgi:hypothetical protein
MSDTTLGGDCWSQFVDRSWLRNCANAGKQRVVVGGLQDWESPNVDEVDEVENL